MQDKAIKSMMTTVSLQLQRATTAEAKLDSAKAFTRPFTSTATRDKKRDNSAATTKAPTLDDVKRARKLERSVEEAVEAEKAAGAAAIAELQAENSAVRADNTNLSARLVRAESALRKHLLRSLVKKEHHRYLRHGWDALFFCGALVIMAEQQEQRRKEVREIEDARAAAAAAEAEVDPLLDELDALEAELAAVKAAAGVAARGSDTGLAAALPASLATSSLSIPTRNDIASATAVDPDAANDIVEPTAAADDAGGGDHGQVSPEHPVAAERNSSTNYGMAADDKLASEKTAARASPEVEEVAPGETAEEAATKASEFALETSSRSSVGKLPVATELISSTSPISNAAGEVKAAAQPPAMRPLDTQAVSTATTPANTVTVLAKGNPASIGGSLAAACASSPAPAASPALGNAGGLLITEVEASSTNPTASLVAAPSTRDVRSESSAIEATPEFSAASGSAICVAAANKTLTVEAERLATEPVSSTSPVSSTPGEMEPASQLPAMRPLDVQAVSTAATPANAITLLVKGNPTSTRASHAAAFASTAAPAASPAKSSTGGWLTTEPETSPTNPRVSLVAAPSTGDVLLETATSGSTAVASVSRVSGLRNRTTSLSRSPSFSSTTVSSRARANAKISTKAASIEATNKTTAGKRTKASTTTTTRCSKLVRGGNALAKPSSPKEAVVTTEKPVAVAPAGSTSRQAIGSPATVPGRPAGSAARAKPASSGPSSAISTATTSASRTKTPSNSRQRSRALENSPTQHGTTTPPRGVSNERRPLTPLRGAAPGIGANSGGQGGDEISGSGKPTSTPLSQSAPVDRTSACRGAKCSRSSSVLVDRNLLPSAPGREGKGASKDESTDNGAAAGAEARARAGAGVGAKTPVSRTASGRSTRAPSRPTEASAKTVHRRRSDKTAAGR